MDARYVTLGAATLALAATAGCASFGRALRGHSAAQPATTAEAQLSTNEASTPHTDARQDAVLQAVEQFLARTEEYQAVDAPRPRPNPSGAAVPNQFGSSRTFDAVSKSEPPPPRYARTQVSGESEPDRASMTNVAAPDRAHANAWMSVAANEPTVQLPTLPVVRSVFVRSKEPVSRDGGDESDGVAQGATANQPLHMPELESRALTERFLDHLRSDVNTRRDFDSEWSLRLVQLALERDHDAVEVSTDLPESSRDLLTSLVRTALAVRGFLHDPAATGHEALRQVDALRRAVADRADPVITDVALCRRVMTFGSYDEMPEEELVAGRATQTIVYSEVENLRVESTDDGQFRTRIATRLEVLSAGGASFWTKEEPEIVDHCRRRRSDFFIAQRITFPATLPPGEYVLKVQIVDLASDRVDEAVHPFVLHASTTVAAGR